MMEENYNPDIIIEALDKSLKLEDFKLEDIPDTLFKWELGGITDPLGQLASWIVDTLSSAISDLGSDVWNWLTTIRDQITSSISGVISSVQSALETAINSVSSAVNSLSSSLSSFITYVEGAFSSVQTAIANLGTTVAGIVTAVQSAVSGVISGIQNLASSVSEFVSTVINQISALGSSIYNYVSSLGESIANTITGLQEWLSTAFTTVTQGLASLGTQIVTAVETIPTAFQTAFAGLTEWLQQAFTTVSAGLAQFGTTLTSFGQQVLAAFNELGISLIEFVNHVRDTITQAWGKLYDFLGEKVKQLYQGLKDVGTTLSGFINPLVEIKNWLFTKFGAIIEFFEKPAQKVTEFGTWLWDGLVTTGQTVWGYIQGFATWLQTTFQNAIAGISAKFSGIVEQGIASPLRIASQRIHELPEGLGEVDILSYVAQGYSIEAAKQMAAIATAEATGEAIGDQEVSAEPLGLGAKVKVKLGAYLKTIARYLKEITLDALKYSFAGFSFWIVEPVRYLAYERLRNTLPVQLPTITEIIEYTRRRLPTTDIRAFFNKAREVLALRGYADWVIDAILKMAEEAKIQITDRFNIQRTIPLSTLYDLPTTSDLCRMMIHDIIINFDDFSKIMLMRGMNKDIAFMYYLLHYRYPTLENLWEFYRRGKAGMLIGKDLYLTPQEQAMIASGFGAQPAPPASFNDGAAENLVPILAQYAKWWDYAFFGWKEGYPSDRTIMLELMARIPMRIDSRWMYKWGIISDEDVKRVVIARGFHDKWIEPITMAECMNALAEERTTARTGILNVFKEGFATEQLLKQSLTKLTTVKILGKDVDVKFLEGETKLLALRAKYDRALDILRDYHRDLVKAFEENVIIWSDVTGALKTTTDALAKGLGIKIAFDGDYYKLYQPVAQSLQNVYTIRRLRYWLRYMMRTFLTRFERGYISKSEIQDIVNEIVEAAKMTDTEKQTMLEVAEMLLTVFNREMLAKGVLRKLSRGVITVDQAKRKLKEMGLEDDVIDAMIEYHAKTYTLTLSQLVSYMEYVPISKEMLQKKIDMLGMPPDEAKVIPAYATARELASEVGRYVTELITDFAKGLLTEQQLKQELDNAATLWGKAKELGVDWVILSPQEREILIKLAKKRRERELAKQKA